MAPVTLDHERILLSAAVFTLISQTFPILHPGFQRVSVIGSEAKFDISAWSALSQKIRNVYFFGSSLSMYHMYSPDPFRILLVS